jgi:hypothetical protein
MTEKTGFDISQLFKPIKTINFRDQKLHLYALNRSDIASLKALDPSEPQAWFVSLLDLTSSFDYDVKLKRERRGLTKEFLADLSETELESVADAYVQSVFLRRISHEAKVLIRSEKESALEYLSKAVPAQIAESERLTRAQFQTLTESLSTPFKALSESHSRLLASVDSFERERAQRTLNEQVAQSSRIIASQTEYSASVRNDRAKEIVAVERTADMTAKSALALGQLIETAGVFMQRFDSRSATADNDVRRQLTIALWGIGVSAILATIALGYSIAAYSQDRDNNRSNDKWQDEVTKLLRDSKDVADKQFDTISKRRNLTESPAQKVEPSKNQVVLP